MDGTRKRDQGYSRELHTLKEDLPDEGERQLRDQLESSKFKTSGKRTLVKDVIQLVERSKHFRSKFTEHELVFKSAYHSKWNIRLAVYTQGIKNIRELLISLEQSWHIVHTEYENRTDSPNASKYGERGKPCEQNEREWEK